MRLRKAGLFSLCFLAALLTGCGSGKEAVQETVLPLEKVEAPLKFKEEERELSEAFLADKKETDRLWEKVRQENTAASEAMQVLGRYAERPADTVEFIPSAEEEITEIQFTESVVDEEDPGTYEVHQKEYEDIAVEEVPEEYIDNAGNVVYEYVDGIWYHYEYSTGNVALDEQDEELALFMLNLDGSYDGFEVQKIECEEKTEENPGVKYEYHVLYRRSEPMEGEPEDVEDLTIGRVRTETVTETIVIEEKVPVSLEEKVGTGEYIYYGWQELDGNTYYFDSDGEPATGWQVIQGIPYLFDSEGIRRSSTGIDVSSRNGDIDWIKVKDAGVEFAMIRAGYRGCTEGMLIRDSRCGEYLKGASAAGIKTGVYFFSQAVNEEEALEEAELVLEMISEYPVSLPVAIDTEYEVDECDARTNRLTADERTACVNAFCRKISDAGYTPAVYGSGNWISGGLDMSVLDGYPLWIAGYGSSIMNSDSWVLLQYATGEETEGISGNVNLDIIYGK